MTDLDKDYKFYKAKEWFNRPAYYVERGEVVDRTRKEEGVSKELQGKVQQNQITI